MRTPASIVFAAALSLGVPLGAGANATQPEPLTEVLTLREAAILLRVEPEVLSRLAEGQRVPARRVETEWRFSRDTLLAWLAGEWTWRSLVDPASVLNRDRGNPAASAILPGPGSALTASASSAITARGGPPGGTLVAQQAVPSERTESTIGSAPQQRSASEVFLRDQRILLAPRDWTLDLGLAYTRRDSPLLTAVAGETTLANARSQSLTSQLVVRYSLLTDTELFASASYGAQRASLDAGALRLSRATRNEAGDIGLGVRRTVIHESVGRPDVIWAVDTRIPTGDTSPALGTGVTLVKSFDPVVLFGTLGYRRTFSRDFADATRLEPRHRFDVTLGYAFALNDTLSLNTAIASSFNRASAFSAANLRASQGSTLQMGMTARLGRGVYVQPSLSYRLNGPGSAFAFGLNVPITLSTTGD